MLYACGFTLIETGKSRTGDGILREKLVFFRRLDWVSENIFEKNSTRIFEYLLAAPAKSLLKSFVIALEAAVKRKNKAMIDTLLSILEQNGELRDLIKDNEVALRWLEKANFWKTEDGGVS